MNQLVKNECFPLKEHGVLKMGTVSVLYQPEAKAKEQAHEGGSSVIASTNSDHAHLQCSLHAEHR